MQPTPYSMTALFDQLGLDSSETAIKAFIQQHQLGHDTPLKYASFWNQAQRQFIEEGWHQDSDWCEWIDQLNIALRPKD